MFGVGKKEKAVVIKLGGSQATDVSGVREDQLNAWFEELNMDLTKKFAHAAFVIGGGQRVRAVQANLRTDTEKDIAGLHVLHEHAGQVQRVLRAQGYGVHSDIPRSPQEAQSILSQQKEFAVALGGLQIGQSTDTVAVTAAEIWQDAGYEAWIVILSNIWNIFTADPSKESSAKPILNSSIDTLVREGVLLNNPAEFRPGMNIPLDPVAVSRLEARQQRGKGIPLWLGHMSDIESVRRFLQQKSLHRGTELRPTTTSTQYSQNR